MIQTLKAKLLSSQNIFLTGGAGVGKTTLTRAIIESYESEGKKVAKLASTGMAATLIGGQTLHSFFDLGICDSIDALDREGKLKPKKKIIKLIESMELIIIDEISMVSSALLEMIHLRLMQADYGKTILVVGDFLQLPPVSRGFERVSFAFESPSWKKLSFETMTLEKIYRTDDLDFIKVLHKVRFGEVGAAEHYYLHHLIKPLGNDLSHYTFLFGKNSSAAVHNKEQLSFIDEEEMLFEADVIKHKKNIPDAQIDRFMNDARIEKKLILKVGAPVLFTRNSWNYFNGERGRIVRIADQKVYVQKSDGQVVKLEAVAISKNNWEEKTVEGKKELLEVAQFSVYQLPLQLAFAITIHKSQGMSISDLIIDTREIFAPSQFYVALSRATSPARLTLIQPLKDWKYLAYVDKKAVDFVQESLKKDFKEETGDEPQK